MGDTMPQNLVDCVCKCHLKLHWTCQLAKTEHVCLKKHKLNGNGKDVKDARSHLHVQVGCIACWAFLPAVPPTVPVGQLEGLQPGTTMVHSLPSSQGIVSSMQNRFCSWRPKHDVWMEHCDGDFRGEGADACQCQPSCPNPFPGKGS